MLAELVSRLQRSLSIQHKQDIQAIAKNMGSQWTKEQIRLGDDCAAIPEGDGFLLLAAEGMLPSLVETDPWFAGWCAVMVNVSDIYAMGGYPIAVVDTIWSHSSEIFQALLAGMQAAAQAYQVSIVGGHTNGRSDYHALSVAILGRAKKLITSFDALPNDVLLIAADFRGQCHPDYPFWNAATHTSPEQLRQNLAILPQLAEAGLCNAGKDISNAGIIGTLLMLIETSSCGAILDLDRLPCPPEMTLERWLNSFPSYGFLLSVRPEFVNEIQSRFHQQDLVCEAIGTFQNTSELTLQYRGESSLFWDCNQQALTGFTRQHSQQA